MTSAPLQRLSLRRQLQRRRALYRLRRSQGRTESKVVDRQTPSPRASRPVLAACTTHFALAMLVSAAAHEAKSAAPEVARNAAFSRPSRGVAGRSGAELVACKRSCSPILAADDEGMFPFEKSKTGLGGALVAGLSASLQRPLAPLRHLCMWLEGAAWYC